MSSVSTSRQFTTRRKSAPVFSGLILVTVSEVLSFWLLIIVLIVFLIFLPNYEILCQASWDGVKPLHGDLVRHSRWKSSSSFRHFSGQNFHNLFIYYCDVTFWIEESCSVSGLKPTKISIWSKFTENRMQPKRFLEMQTIYFLESSNSYFGGTAV